MKLCQKVLQKYLPMETLHNQPPHGMSVTVTSTVRGIYPSDPLNLSILNSQDGQASSLIISSGVAVGENSQKHQPVTWTDANGSIQDILADSIHSGAPYLTVNDYEAWSRHCKHGKLYDKSLG